jgi:fimbrial isopeptide formation D2 family protein
LDGEDWIYDVTVYPKNVTGKPNLKKEVAEVTSDGAQLVYDTAVSASMGDVLAYQVTSKLPVITSQATWLTVYTFTDTMDKGLSYCQTEPVTMTWKDANGTVAAVWQKTDGKFSAAYGTDENGCPTMVLSMTKTGLAEINPAYSEYTVVIDYKATLNQDETVILGDGGNGNEVVLQWKRSNMNYVDTLTAGTGYTPDPNQPDEHTHSPAVYTFGIELQKLFSDGNGKPEKVQFKVYNATDKYYLTARKAQDGQYYVTGKADEENGATIISPAADGSLKLYGVEADTYVLTELVTDSGYTLLKDDICIAITARVSTVSCSVEECTHTEHKFLSASATVNGEKVTLRGRNAIVPLTIVNERGYDIPVTGDNGIFALPLLGITGAAGLILLRTIRQRKRREQQ